MNFSMGQKVYCLSCGTNYVLKKENDDLCDCGSPIIREHIIQKDIVNAPDHYRDIPGVECIDVTKHFNFSRGSAIKYIWRAGKKDKTKEIEDLRKAIKYLEIEIARLQESEK